MEVGDGTLPRTFPFAFKIACLRAISALLATDPDIFAGINTGEMGRTW